MKLPKLAKICESIQEATPVNPAGYAGPERRKPANTPKPYDAAPDIATALEKSNRANPVMFTTKLGLAAVHKDPSGGYAIKIGKTSFPPVPTYVLADEEAMHNWLRDVGAMSVGVR